MPIHNDTTHCIYRIVCFATGHVYVGQAKNGRNRKSRHFSMLRNNTHFNEHLQRAFKKYGEGSFFFEIIEKNIERNEIDTREIYWIAHFDSYKNGYNKSVGGANAKINFGTPCTWNGITYSSITDASYANGIDHTVMLWRLSQGYTRDSDMKGKGSNPFNAKKTTWNGITYSSLEQCAKANGIDGQSMSDRLSRGHTCDADLDTNGGRFHPKEVTWNGISYPSVKACAIANNVARPTMGQRLRKGYTCDADMKR